MSAGLSASEEGIQLLEGTPHWEAISNARLVSQFDAPPSCSAIHALVACRWIFGPNLFQVQQQNENWQEHGFLFFRALFRHAKCLHCPICHRLQMDAAPFEPLPNIQQTACGHRQVTCCSQRSAIVKVQPFGAKQQTGQCAFVCMHDEQQRCMNKLHRPCNQMQQLDAAIKWPTVFCVGFGAACPASI